MLTKQLSLIPLFEQFIKASYSGKRLKPDGRKIKKQTVDNYMYALLNLKEFEHHTKQQLRITILKGQNKRLLINERNYWKKFYKQFTDYMYKQKGCYDNYTGSVIKMIKIFFNYLKNEKLLPIGDFHKHFYVAKEEVEIITLLPEQLQFLISNTTFHNSLSLTLQRSKKIFVLGCTVALRSSDLFNIKFSDIERVGASSYLVIKSLKTEVTTRIKLPAYALDIIEDFRKTGKKRKTILPYMSISRFNKNIRLIAEKAGWIFEREKVRCQGGKNMEIFRNGKRSYRFCDLLSSHVMRRTAITTMLMLGMPEHVVKKISGHSMNSKAFYRYVNLVQSYLDTETD
jgi:site-specific recombinase XerD